MNTACCCEAHGTRPGDGPVRRWLNAGGSVIPGVIAILLPKCPLCVAAWVAAGTGVALPAIVTTNLRPALWILCALSAALLLLRSDVAQRLLSAASRLISTRFGRAPDPLYSFSAMFVQQAHHRK